MNENFKEVKARVSHKCKTEAQWYLDVYISADSDIKRSNPFIPFKGELIIFDSEIENGNILELPKGRDIPYDYKRVKIGDGIHDVIDLPFTDESLRSLINENKILYVANGSEVGSVTIGSENEAKAINSLATGYKSKAISEGTFAMGYCFSIPTTAGILSSNLCEKDSSSIIDNVGTFYFACSKDISGVVNQEVTLQINNNFDLCGTCSSIENTNIEYYDENNIQLPVYKITINLNTNNLETLVRLLGNWQSGSDYVARIWFPYSPEVGELDQGRAAHAEGADALAVNLAAHAEGYGTLAFGKYSHAEGRETKSTYAAHSEGGFTAAMGEYTHAEGKTTKAIGNQSHAEGNETTSEGDASHSEGAFTSALGVRSHAEGSKTTAIGEASHSEGFSSIIPTVDDGSDWSRNYNAAIGIAAHTEGKDNIALGPYSHAEGQMNISSGEASHTEGSRNQATGKDCHAEGYTTIASNKCSHSEGSAAQATGFASHAEGGNTVASSNFAHAQNEFTQAKKKGSTATGYYTVANHKYSFTAGSYTTSSRDNQFIVGESNANNANALFIVGNGVVPVAATDTAAEIKQVKSNAFTVNKDGTATVATNPINNMDVATKDYVDSAIANVPGGATDITIATNNEPGIVRASNEVVTTLPDKTYNLTPIFECDYVEYRWTGGDINFIAGNEYLITIPDEPVSEIEDVSFTNHEDEVEVDYFRCPLNTLFTASRTVSYKEAELSDSINTGPRIYFGYSSELSVASQMIIQEIEHTPGPDWKVSVDPITGEMSVNTVDATTSKKGLVNLQQVHNIAKSYTSSYPTTTSAGVVKSGGDVTITNGIISVNDNSHKHTLANISDINTKIATNDSLGFVKGKQDQKEFVTSLGVYNWCSSYAWYGKPTQWGYVDNLELLDNHKYIVIHENGSTVKAKMALGDAWNGSIEQSDLFTNTTFTVEANADYCYHIAIWNNDLPTDGWKLYEIIDEAQTGDILVNDDGTMKANIPITETSLSLKDAITGELYTITIENGQIKATKA